MTTPATCHTGASASSEDWPHTADDGRPEKSKHQQANKGSSKPKRQKNRQQRKSAERERAIDESLMLHYVFTYAYMCTGAIVISTMATLQNQEQDILEFGDPKHDSRRKTWAERCREARAAIDKMFQVNRGFTVDSGAADHVIPFGWINFIEVLQGIAARMGITYVAASGTRIPNQGEQRVPFMTREGSWMEIMFQVAKINKPLLSVSKLIDSEMRVVFDKSGSNIYNKVTGDIVRIKRERGVFVLEAFTNEDPAKPAKAHTGFSRHD